MQKRLPSGHNNQVKLNFLSVVRNKKNKKNFDYRCLNVEEIQMWSTVKTFMTANVSTYDNIQISG